MTSKCMPSEKQWLVVAVPFKLLKLTIEEDGDLRNFSKVNTLITYYIHFRLKS